MVTGISDLLYNVLPRPRAEKPPIDSVKRCLNVLLLGKKDNPTIYYYFRRRLETLFDGKTRILMIDGDEIEGTDPRGLFVIICRYINPNCLKWLERNRKHLAGIALFVDDDYAAILSDRSAPFTYKMSVFYYGIFNIPRLNRILSSVWVSTPALKRSISEHAVVLPPAPPPEDFPAHPEQSATSIVRVGYHGTAIHEREHLFLKPVVASVLREFPQVQFEVIASGRCASIWHDANIHREQLKVVPQMSWPEYRAYASSHQLDIALVPLLESRLNIVRSDTKRVDIARLGAAAVFSETETYNRYRQRGEVHLKNEVPAWISALTRLIVNPEARNLARDATRNSVKKMYDEASLSFPNIRVI